jgi:hypothetical protein
MRKIACTFLIAGLVATSSMAQDAATPTQAAVTGTAAAAAPVATADAATVDAAAQEPAPGPKRVVVTTGFDFATAYMFRGIYQEDSGTVAPVYADVAVNLDRGVTLNFGNWSSLHSGPSGHGGHGNAWYESDYYGSATFTFGKVKPGVLYTSYTSPNDVFATVHELAGVLAYDDSSSPFPLSPKAILGFELGGGQADGGANRGTYLELGIKPALKAAPKLTVYVPVKVGLSVKDYYEGATGSNRFGYFDTGIIASVPLSFGGGSWEVHGGVDFLWLGDNMALLNSGDDFKPVGIIGMTFTY